MLSSKVRMLATLSKLGSLTRATTEIANEHCRGFYRAALTNRCLGLALRSDRCSDGIVPHVRNFASNSAAATVQYTNASNLPSTMWSYGVELLDHQQPTLCRWSHSGPDSAEHRHDVTQDAISRLRCYDVETPLINRPDDVLIEVFAASVNPIDVLIINGYGSSVLHTMRVVDTVCSGGKEANSEALHTIAGRDFVGVVTATGRGVKNVRAGQIVMGVVSPHRPGSHSQFVLTSSSNVVSLPENSTKDTLLQFAGVPYAALTAYSAVAVFACGGVNPATALRGARVLVTGAAGGVGTLLVQMLRTWDVQVSAICGYDSFDLMLSLGITEMYDYNDNEAIQALAVEQRFDLVFDCSGCRDMRYLTLARPHAGSYITLSSPLLSNTDKLGLLPGALKSAWDLACQNFTSLSGSQWLVKWAYFMPNASGLLLVRDMLLQKLLTPIVDNVFAVTAIEDAYRHMTVGRHCGKTVLDIKT